MMSEKKSYSSKEAFEEIVDRAEMKQLTRQEYRGVTIFIAEGLYPLEKRDPENHIRTLWAIARGETRLDLASWLTFDKHTISTEQSRKNSALKDAKQVIKSLRKGGFYE